MDFRLLAMTILGGWFGLHQFAVGRTAKGLLYVFTFGLFTIGWIVDIYLVANGKLATREIVLERNRTGIWNLDDLICKYPGCSEKVMADYGDACSVDHRDYMRDNRNSQYQQDLLTRSPSAELNTRNSPVGRNAIVCPMCLQSGGVIVQYREDNSSFKKLTKSLMSGGVLASRVKILKCTICNQTTNLGPAGIFKNN